MKVVSSKTVYKAKYFQIDQKTIERGGKTFTKDIIVRSSSVLIIPFTKENNIYIEDQFRDALGKRVLEVVAGQIEKGATPLETAMKELKEETGLTAATWHKFAEWDVSPNMISKVHVFAATDLTEGKSALEDEEDIKVLKLPLASVIEKIDNGDMCISTHIGALFLFKKLREEGKI